MDRTRSALLAVWLPLVVAAGAGCSAPAEPTAPVVVASVPPLAWLAEALSPPGAFEVVSLVQPGQSPTTHQPGVREARALARAALWVRVGHPHFPFERAWLDPVLGDVPGLRVVSVFEGAEPRTDDPHVWLAPRRMHDTADRLAAALASLAPGAADAIEARRRDVGALVASVDADLRATLAPFRGRPFVVFHPAFSHLADAYGLVQLAVEAKHREASGPDLARVLHRAREAGVRAVYVQPQFDQAAARVVADALGAELRVLDPLAPDWPAAMRRTGVALASGFAP